MIYTARLFYFICQKRFKINFSCFSLKPSCLWKVPVSLILFIKFASNLRQHFRFVFKTVIFLPTAVKLRDSHCELIFHWILYLALVAWVLVFALLRNHFSFLISLDLCQIINIKSKQWNGNTWTCRLTLNHWTFRGNR